MLFESFPAGIYQANCYIIGDEKTHDGFIIDAGGDSDDIIAECKKIGIENIEYILLTHGHGDHIGGVLEIKDKTGCKVMMSRKDEFLLSDDTNPVPLHRNGRYFIVDDYLKSGDMLKAGEITIEVIETPGHTPGGLSFKIGERIFSGDTIFRNSVGRADFPKSSYQQLIDSIRNNIITLPDNTVIYPGHGPSTTVGNEKKYNQFL